MTPALEKFLAIKRWKQLGAAWDASANEPQARQISTAVLLLFLLLSCVPVAALAADAFYDWVPSSYPIYAFGLCTLLALVLQRVLGTAGIGYRLSFEHLSLTHTAVALGCIPAVLILLIDPTVLAERSELLNRVVVDPSTAPGERPKPLVLIGSLLFIAGWVAVTEEIIFRGVLLSAIRRWRGFSSPRIANLSAIFISSLLFGLAHVPAWGVLPAIALGGLGLGFGIAYVVTKEDIAPIILYHFAFDVLSMSIAIFL